VALVVESVPSSWRGHVVNVTSAFFVFGEIFAAILLVIFMPQLGGYHGHTWRWVSGMAILPSILILPVAALMMQETPHFLLSKGRTEEALAVVKYMAALNRNTAVVDGLVSLHIGAAPEAPDDAEAPPQDPAVAVEGRADSGGTGGEGEQTKAASSAIASSATVSQRLALALNEEYRPILIGGCFLLFACNFQFYGLMYSLPIVFAHMPVPVNPAFQVLATSLWDIPGVVLTWILVRSKELGHRDGLFGLNLLSAMLFLTMTTLDLGEVGVWVSLPASYLAKFTASAFFTLSYVYFAEVFPSSCRSTALSVCIAAGRIGSIVAPEVFDGLTSDARHWRFFTLCAIISLISLLVTRFALIFERKNQSLEEAAASPKQDQGKALPVGDEAAPLAAAAGDALAAGGTYGTTAR